MFSIFRIRWPTESKKCCTPPIWELILYPTGIYDKLPNRWCTLFLSVLPSRYAGSLEYSPPGSDDPGISDIDNDSGHYKPEFPSVKRLSSLLPDYGDQVVWQAGSGRTEHELSSQIANQKEKQKEVGAAGLSPTGSLPDDLGFHNVEISS